MNLDEAFPGGLSLGEAIDLLGPVAIYVAAVAAYAIFIFHFYQFVARRDMFGLDLSRYEESRFQRVRSFLHVVMYVVKYLVVFPAFAFFWFAVLTIMLSLLSKDREFADIVLTGLATVSAIRVTAYWNEDLSSDLAKIMPFAVLAIALIDVSFFELEGALDTLREADVHRERILYYMLFLVALEFVLRIALGAFAAASGGSAPPTAADEDEPDEDGPGDGGPGPADEDDADSTDPATGGQVVVRRTRRVRFGRLRITRRQ